jgi:hypothetical protein
VDVHCQQQDVLDACQGATRCHDSIADLQHEMQVKVREGDTVWGWGIVVCVTRRPPAPNGASNGHAAAGAADQYLLDTLLPCAPGSVASALPVLQKCKHQRSRRQCNLPNPCAVRGRLRYERSCGPCQNSQASYVQRSHHNPL